MGSFHTSALFRYFFFDWLFHDANVNELYQRAAAISHNKAQRHHLLVYLRRWIALTLVMLFPGIMLEQMNALACTFFYTTAALCTCTIVKIAVAWVFLGQKNL